MVQLNSVTNGAEYYSRGARVGRLPHGKARSLIALLVLGMSGTASAQAPGSSLARADSAAVRATLDALALDSLVARALIMSPKVRAAAARVEAARHRVAPAGARPDPMLMAGVQNFPVSEPGFDDFMTMKMVGIGQTIPYPGKLSLAKRVAEWELDASTRRLEDTKLEVMLEVKDAYFELAYLDRALDVLRRQQDVLVGFMKVAEARYGAGTGEQPEVLRARIEAIRSSEQAAALAEQRRATLALLNATLDRPSETPVTWAAIPARVLRAALGDSAGRARFVSSALGARVADSPLPPLTELQEGAVRESPMLGEHEAMIAAQAARAELDRKAHLPDFDLSLQYGQRNNRSDMVTATVSIPFAIQRGRKQSETAAASRAELAALQAEHHAKVNEIRADVARLHADLERDRSQLALYSSAIIPQGQAVLESATASFRVGRTSFLTLLDSQNTLFSYETAYARVLTGFAQQLAELERVVGREVVP